MLKYTIKTYAKSVRDVMSTNGSYPKRVEPDLFEFRQKIDTSRLPGEPRLWAEHSRSGEKGSRLASALHLKSISLC